MKPHYHDGKLGYLAETVEEGYDLAEIVERARADGYPLNVIREAKTVRIEGELLKRARAEKKAHKGGNGKHEPLDPAGTEANGEQAANTEAPAS